MLRDGCGMGLGALLDSPSEGAVHSTDDGTVLCFGLRARSPKLKASSCAQQEHGQEVGQALPGSVAGSSA